MRTRHAFLFGSIVAIVAAVAATGCSKKETLPSDEVATAGFSLDFKVTNDGVKTSVYAAVHVGSWDSNTFARLVSGDTLRLTLADGSVATLGELTATAGSSEKTYYASDSVPQADGVFKLDLLRQKGAAATNNTLQMPAAFTVTAPATAVSRRSPVTLSFAWGSTSTGYTTKIDADGDCIFSTTKTVEGSPPTFTFNAGDLSSLSGSEKNACNVKFVVTRSLRTTSGFSSEFHHESQAEGVQIRTVLVSTSE